MIKKVFTTLLILLCLPGFFLTACDSGSSASKNRILDIGADADPAIVASLPFQHRSFQMGTAGFVPDHYPDSTENDWQSFFSNDAAEYGGLFGIHLSPSSDKNANDILLQVRMAYEEMDYVIPYIELGVSHENGPFTLSKGKELVRVAKANAEKYKPEYFSIGVEINSFYLHQPDTYDLYIDYALQALDEIKKVSPDTIRMTNFQLDYMKGNTALSGESFPAHWELINDFNGKIEALSFTVYPFLHYPNVTEIPDNYLREISRHSNLPILITETGWPTVNLLSGVEGSEQKQIHYMVKIAEQAVQEDVQALIWVLPRDAEFGVAGGIFDNISLFTNNGKAKPAYEYWKAINTLEKL